jgi:tRNA A22 N-methylase
MSRSSSDAGTAGIGGRQIKRVVRRLLAKMNSNDRKLVLFPVQRMTHGKGQLVL